ncbi:hypothetical protein AB0B48_07275 [Micromonospora sp. NPDC049089]|uniref:hypothetical protein n=1 Tax=Micromonospora sp. NPDC049089 TaxID=3155496 RepID=UPI0033CE6DFA
MLIAAAAGAGFVVAALFQGPAAADGLRDGSGDEPHRIVGGLVESVAQLTVAERPRDVRQAPPGADERRRDGLRAPLGGPIRDVVASREKPPPTDLRRSTGAPRVTAPVPVRAAERERLRPASVARAAHRPVRHVELAQPAADAPRQPAAPAPPVVRAPTVSPVVGLIAAPLPSVVDIVNAVPIRPIVMALLCVADAVLPPVARPVTVPAATPPLPAPPAVTPVTGPAPAAAVAALPAVPAPAAVHAAAPPSAPHRMSVVGPARAAVSTGHPTAHPSPVDVGELLSGQPIAPADQDAASVDNGSTPGPGLARPLERQSHVDAGPPADLVPLLVESRALSPMTRPG